jgi:hypothetical protein
MRARNAVERDPTAYFTTTGLGALAAGAAVYLVVRGAGGSRLPDGLGLDPWPLLTGALPSLLHAGSFTLLTAAALGAGRRALIAAAIGWTAVGWAFEALQHPAVASALWPQPARLADGDALAAVHTALAAHAHRGTFDPLDVVATAVGAACAVALGRRRLGTRA